MKYLILIGLFFLSSCSCGGSEHLESLSQETLEWLIPYNNKDYFIFEDKEGNRDSLKVERISDKILCSDEEQCSRYCETEVATLVSIINPEIKLNVTIDSDHQIYINRGYLQDKYIQLYFITIDNDYTSISENFSLIRRTDYFRVDCKNNSNYFNYPMKGMIFTKQQGLIEYTTTDNRKWTKVN